MANVEHSTMVSADVHEPKHISDTTSADAGKVITPLSGGTSELRNLTPGEVGVQEIYGEAALDANTESFALPAPSDATLYTEGDYKQLESIRVPGVYLDHSNGVTLNSSNGLEVTVNGDYEVHFWMSLKSDTNNTTIGIKGKENGTFANFTMKHDLTTANQQQVVMAHIYTTLTTGNAFTLWMAADKACSITIEDMRYTVNLLRAA